jgi:hypothetical protein
LTSRAFFCPISRRVTIVTLKNSTPQFSDSTANHVDDRNHLLSSLYFTSESPNNSLPNI